MRSEVEIVADVGEGFGRWALGDDQEIMPYVTTANVACGFHASDPVTMVNTIDLAKAREVAVGAHPGLPDLLGFGRRVLSLTPTEMYAYVAYQVGALAGIANCRGIELHHVTPHGALYVMLRDDPDLARAFLLASRDVLRHPLVYWVAPTTGARMAEVADDLGMTLVGVLCIDLELNPDGTLRFEATKARTNVRRVYDQVRRFIESATVEAIDGTSVHVDASSLLFHGDGPNVREVAKAIHRAAGDSGCTVRALSAAR